MPPPSSRPTTVTFRDALDATIVRIAADAWLGRLPATNGEVPSAA